jgi:DNA-binding ferritin-like protein
MNVITPLIQFQQQLRIYHWQTDSYAAHKAFGKAYEGLDDLIDSFLEVYMGYFGRSKPTTTFVIELKPLISMESVFTILDSFQNYLRDMDEELEKYSDLLNIRDSLLQEVSHLRYRLSLN